MKRISFALVIGLVCLTATPLVAQDEMGGNLARAFTLTVSPDNVLAFEESYKKHIKWHADNEDTWTWDTWQVMAGDMGEYVVRTPGHFWGDFDTPPFGIEDRDHFLEHCAQHVNSISSTFTELMPDVSRLPAPDATRPLVTVVEMKIVSGGVLDFMHAIARVHEAIEKTSWPAEYAWLAQMSGGEGPTFYLVLLHKSWADVADPETPFPMMLEEALGRPEATAIMAIFDEVVERQSSKIYSLREDLSYRPGN